MTASSSYDVLIIGGGQAGIPLACALAKAGKRVALAERKDLGGSCVNYGCTPTKSVIASAKLAYQARRAGEFGLVIPKVEIDFPAVLRKAREIVLESRNGLDQGFSGTDNPRLLRGDARFEKRSEAAFQLSVGPEAITAKEVVVNTGTRTAIPNGVREPYLTAENWLNQSELPKKLFILGGGYIGIEMAQFYRRMGSAVTVIHHGPQILPKEDEDVASAIQGFLQEEGIEFRLNSHEMPTTGQVFVATGRTPANGLGLDTVGVDLDEHGYIKIDKRLATNVPGIWAAGDIRGGPQFTHTSWDDFRILESQMLGDGKRTTDRIVPYAVFCDPELGRVGLTEREAAKQRLNYKILKYEMKKNGKAREIRETRGFIKVIADKDSGKILGAAVLAAEGAELVHMYVDVMNAGAPTGAIENAIHIHPTLAEAVQSAVSP